VRQGRQVGDGNWRCGRKRLLRGSGLKDKDGGKDEQRDRKLFAWLEGDLDMREPI
jgi:hypothetical protein